MSVDTTCRRIVRLLYESRRPIHRNRVFKKFGAPVCRCKKPHMTSRGTDLSDIELETRICSGITALRQIGCIVRGHVHNSYRYEPWIFWTGIKLLPPSAWRFIPPKEVL